MSGSCPCVECGCEGNESCGCFHVNESKGCALGSDLVCPCCDFLGAEANKKRWSENKADPNQIDLFN
jgi:hypothetical protein